MQAGMIGEAPEFETVLRAARIVAATEVSVLILGESGTGKELLAREIHAASRRAEKPFIVVNCAALPENLAESELFGHARGAFTGANQARRGRIRAAHGGTLFLDEIGELPLAIQAKLLRFLESGECQVVGQTRPGHSDARILAATNRDLREEVKTGKFRADLYYRLNVVPLQLPPLRERSGDIPRLLRALTQQLSQHYELPAPRYQRRALEILQNYPWPGNVRELRNFCERMLILCPGQNLGPDNLPPEFRREAGGGETGSDSPCFCLPEQGIHMDTLESQLIQQALRKSRGNRGRAADLLGLSRDTLVYRIKKHAIKV